MTSNQNYRNNSEYYEDSKKYNSGNSFYCKCCKRDYKTSVYNTSHFNSKKHITNKEKYDKEVLYKTPELLSKDYGKDLFILEDLVKEKFISKEIILMKMEMDIAELKNKRSLLKKENKIHEKNRKILFKQLEDKKIDIHKYSNMTDILVNKISDIHREIGVINVLKHLIQDIISNYKGVKLVLSEIDIFSKRNTYKSINKYPMLYKEHINKYKL